MGQNGYFWPLSEKVFTQSNSNLVCTYCVSVQNWFAFGPQCPNFGPAVAQKWLKLAARGFRPLSGKLITQVISNLVYAFVRWVARFAFGWRWSNFGPLVAKKRPKIGRIVALDHYLNKYSHNTIQTWHVNLLGEQNWFVFGPLWPNSGPLVAKKLLKIVVSHHYLKNYSRNRIFFKLGVYTYWVSIQNWFAIGHWSNCCVGQIVALKDTLHPVHMRQPVVEVGTKHCQPVDAVDTKGCCCNTCFGRFHRLFTPAQDWQGCCGLFVRNLTI